MFQIGIGQSVPLLPDNLSVQLKDIFRQCISRFGRERTIGRGEEKRDGMGEREREIEIKRGGGKRERKRD